MLEKLVQAAGTADGGKKKGCLKAWYLALNAWGCMTIHTIHVFSSRLMCSVL